MPQPGKAEFAPTINSASRNACKKGQYATRQSLSNSFNNSLKLDKRARRRWQRLSGYRNSYTKYVIKRNDGEAIGSNRLKWFYSSFTAIRYGDNERPSIFSIARTPGSICLYPTRPRHLRDCTRGQ